MTRKSQQCCGLHGCLLPQLNGLGVAYRRIKFGHLRATAPQHCYLQDLTGTNVPHKRQSCQWNLPGCRQSTCTSKIIYISLKVKLYSRRLWHVTRYRGRNRPVWVQEVTWTQSDWLRQWQASTSHVKEVWRLVLQPRIREMPGNRWFSSITPDKQHGSILKQATTSSFHSQTTLYNRSSL